MSTRSLSRKEEIRNASVDYNGKVGKLLVLGGDGILSEEEYLELNKNPSFIAGAEWADKIMLDRVCEFIRKRFTETIVGNVISRQETTINEVINDLRKSVEE